MEEAECVDTVDKIETEDDECKQIASDWLTRDWVRTDANWGEAPRSMSRCSSAFYGGLVAKALATTLEDITGGPRWVK